MGVDLYNQLSSASRMVLENRAHFYGCKNQAICEQVQKDFASLFNPSDLNWQQNILLEADIVFSKLLPVF